MVNIIVDKSNYVKEGINVDIAKMRRFNRDFTIYLGVYQQDLFDLNYSTLALRILEEIDLVPGRNAKDLSKLLNVDKGYLSRIIKKLLADEQIEKIQDPTDKRYWKLYVTKKGHELAQKLDQASDRHVKELFKNFSAEQSAEIQKSIELLQTALDELKEDGN